ncbi:hypothetical protein F2Q69_00023133 [Brassica cretica]|uniref:Retrotransposon gag domain-containing protein n=1 Tax=Brassica cretica TaxID=69181 RepID=A0A8S9Q4D4_BRACR|nr:hypothetical protein F2Q69_00023133 [Brassica cretica]
MAVDEQNELPEATQRDAELQRQLDDNESESKPDKEAPEGVATTESPMAAYLEELFSKRLDAMQSMVERLPGVAPPIRKSNPDSYADTPFTNEITLIEMPRKFSFPRTKAYDGTRDPDYHVVQYRQRLLAVALQRSPYPPSLYSVFLEQFASSRDLEKTSDGLYEILQHRAEPLRVYIARFNQEKVAIPGCNIPTAISAFNRGLLPDGDLYKELTKYQCKTMEDVLSRA